MIAKLFKNLAAECIVAAYRNDPELERQIPLRLVLLAVCQSWPIKEGGKFVELVEMAFPGICASTFDACVCSPLWHCLYNKNCYGEYYDYTSHKWRKRESEWDQNRLMANLLNVGCDPTKGNQFGLSFESVKP